MRQWLNGWTGPGGGAGGVAGTGHAPPVAVPGGAPAPVGPTRGLDDKQSTLSRWAIAIIQNPLHVTSTIGIEKSFATVSGSDINEILLQ